MKMVLICLALITQVLLFSCSKDSPVKTTPKEEPDYRDKYIGNYDCLVTHIQDMQGQSRMQKDTFTTIHLTKDEGKDSALVISFFENKKLFYLMPNANIHDYIITFNPPYYGDSVGYFKIDSMYLYWLVSRSPGGSELFMMKGKKQ
ncbi:hypothetical protein AEM51_02190 [Bacteroidetes bacterium UKL13-3]|jgi:hypothetical protein|nr:hypothetical protein AEM51_02190 [Bacteroidetes bacterium UKL13-3]HCP94439.1 hypothetical protein [Bacteroidota bacterium]